MAESKRKKPGDARQSVGRVGEHLAANALEERGYRILERNFRCQYGEIDLVAGLASLASWKRFASINMQLRHHKFRLTTIEHFTYSMGGFRSWQIFWIR